MPVSQLPLVQPQAQISPTAAAAQYQSLADYATYAYPGIYSIAQYKPTSQSTPQTLPSCMIQSLCSRFHGSRVPDIPDSGVGRVRPLSTPD